MTDARMVTLSAQRLSLCWGSGGGLALDTNMERISNLIVASPTPCARVLAELTFAVYAMLEAARSRDPIGIYE